MLVLAHVRMMRWPGQADATYSASRHARVREGGVAGTETLVREGAAEIP